MSKQIKAQIGDMVHYVDRVCLPAVIVQIVEENYSLTEVQEHDVVLTVFRPDRIDLGVKSNFDADGQSWNGCWHWMSDCED